ncbi:hypothetical protein CHARACLAT_007346 [Characodon lateralis]|uniref:Uncharacterized protein n=1 Tax=Characodon lateralis TaxID=208331 RepID=A0ABU7CL85_9TELE|nr:hypothetical protein [Characodon lateralis]
MSYKCQISRVKPLLNQRQHQTWAKEQRTGLFLSGSKSSFQKKVKFAFYLEIKVKSLEKWRGTESTLLEVQCKVPQSVIIWGAVSSAGVCTVKGCSWNGPKCRQAGRGSMGSGTCLI